MDLPDQLDTELGPPGKKPSAPGTSASPGATYAGPCSAKPRTCTWWSRSACPARNTWCTAFPPRRGNARTHHQQHLDRDPDVVQRVLPHELGALHRAAAARPGPVSASGPRLPWRRDRCHPHPDRLHVRPWAGLPVRLRTVGSRRGTAPRRGPRLRHQLPQTPPSDRPMIGTLSLPRVNPCASGC